VDAGLKKDYNHDTDSGVRRPVVHAAGYKTGTPTRCHSVALHSDCAVLYEVCILSLVPGLVRGPRLGFSLGGQGGEQVQSLCLVDPTADRVAKYDGQANSIRRLCSTRDEESALHMIATWSYSKRAWRGLEQWLGIAWQPLPGAQLQTLQIMVESDDSAEQTRGRRPDAKIHIHHLELWKERCRGVFHNKAMSDQQLQKIIRNDADQW
jgi:hypothetical protein